MYIFSMLQFPLTVSYVAGKGANDRNMHRSQEILPGRQQVDDEVWEKIKGKVQPWIDKGFARVSTATRDDLRQAEVSRLLSGPDKGMITTLSKKAAPIASGRINDTDFEIIGG